MKATTIRLPDELVDELDDEADAQDIGRSEYIRQILEQRHRPNTRPNTQSTPKPRGDGQRVECDKCDHGWQYSGDLPRATCPACGSKVWVDRD